MQKTGDGINRPSAIVTAITSEVNIKFSSQHKLK